MIRILRKLRWFALRLELCLLEALVVHKIKVRQEFPAHRQIRFLTYLNLVCRLVYVLRGP